MECIPCGRVFASEFSYRRHLASRLHERNEDNVVGGLEPGSKFICPICGAAFIRHSNYKRHVDLAHMEGEEGLRFRCGLCRRSFPTREEVAGHRRAEHVQHHDFKLEQSAHRRQTQLLRAYFPDRVRTLDEALFYAYSQLQKLLTSTLVEVPFFKCFITVFVEMVRYDDDGEITASEVFPFRGHAIKVGRELEVWEDLRKALGDVERSVGEFIFQGSGWVVERPIYMDVELAECRVLKGGASCGRHVAAYRRGRGVVPANIRCEPDEEDIDDGMCFYLAVASHFLPAAESVAELRDWMVRHLTIRDRGRGKAREVSLEMVRQFEADNPELDLSINVVYRDDSDAVVPVVASSNPMGKNLIVLMLFHLREGEAEGMHYALVRRPGQLFSERTEDSWGKLQSRRVFICFNCFNTIRSEGGYQQHVAFCHQRGCQRVTLPRRGEVVEFDEGRAGSDPRTFLSAFLLFFDFEALQVEPARRCACPEQRVLAREWWDGLSEEARQEHLLEQQMLVGEAEDEWRADVAVDGSRRRRPQPVPRERRLPLMCQHKIRVLKNQPPFAYSLLLVDRTGKVREKKTYVGLDAAENFITTVLNLADKYLPQLSPGVPIEKLSQADRRKAYSAERCYICEKAFSPFCRRCLDHDHLTGELLGTAHDFCNLRRRENVQLTCFAHNFSGYDSHFLVRALAREPRVKQQWAVPMNTQKFKAVTVNRRIRFLDSCQFLPDSLATLTETLVASGCPFSILADMVAGPGEKELLLRKGVYPYSFATSPEALAAATSLPAREHFFSELSGEECSPADYEHARRVWDAFACRNMLEYTALYVRADVYLLAEVVMDHRNLVWKNFGLDICQYLSLPHVAKDAMLKFTGAKMELIHDQEMSYLLQNNIRGGLSYVNLRHATRRVSDEATSPAQAEALRRNPRTLLYLDANNLYGFAMSAPLPQRGFRWMTPEELEKFDPLHSVTLDDGPGYILEVDLEYPEELHLRHNSFPLAPESLEITSADLSPYSASCLEVLGQSSERYKARKLTSTFRPRRRYLLHGLNLALYLRHGLRLTKIHRGITFHQARYLEPYITTCTRKRAEAATKSEANMYKSYCNAAYGKMIESLEKRMDACFNRDRESALRRTSSPLFKGSLVCDENLTISFLAKKELRMRQCWAVGFAILELSKWHMASLYYDRIVPAVGEGKVTVVMSDTDSFLLAIGSDSEDKTMELLAPYMDFSNLDKSHPLYSAENARVPGLLKNEVPKAIIQEVVAIRSKTYTVQSRPRPLPPPTAGLRPRPYLPLPARLESKAKGVTGASRRRLTLHDYRRCLRNMAKVEVDEKQIRSVRHVNQLVESRKVAFSSFDDKRYLTCPIHSVPYGSSLLGTRDYYQMEDYCYFCEHTDEMY